MYSDLQCLCSIIQLSSVEGSLRPKGKVIRALN
jgi:hypothetical protein